MQALEGIRVLDLSRLAPGPFCSMVLADLGAEVLLVEAPEGATSGFDRPTAVSDAARRNAHNALRRNKRSVVLNLKTARGREVLYRLAAEADVVLEGFRPGVTDRLGVGYGTLREINPRLIYCSLSGYGQDGPYAGRVGHDINYLSVAGFQAAVGNEAGPAIPLNVVADFAGGGLMAAMSILAALIARQRTGEGQHVDIAMSDGVLYLMAMAVSGVLAGEPAPLPGNHYLSGMLPQYHAYRCADGRWISLGSLEGKFWRNLCRVMDCEQWADRPFDPEIRAAARTHFARRFAERSREEWMQRLGEEELCIAPVLSLDEALEDPHNRARGMVGTVRHPTFGEVPQVGVGPKLSATPGTLRSAPPEPGRDTEEVLRALGYDEAGVAALRDEGVVA